MSEEMEQPAAESAPPPTEGEPKGKYYANEWCGRPNYGCPYCGYFTLDGDDAVEMHILERVERQNERHMRALEIQ